MVTLPVQFLATKYPGYFFNVEDEKLYSLKIDGILKPLKKHTPTYFNQLGRFTNAGAFQCSVKGQRRWLSLEQLRKLKDNDTLIPVRSK